MPGLFREAAGVHTKELAMVFGRNINVSVWQIVVSGPNVTVIKSTTFTVTVSVLVQPFSCIVTMYLVVSFGNTIGRLVLAARIFLLGNQLNVPLPVTGISKLSTLQITVSLKGRLINGLSLMVMAFLALSIQPLLLSETSVTKTLIPFAYL